MFLSTTPSKLFLSLFLVAFLSEWASAQLPPYNYRRQTATPNGQTQASNTPVNYFECGFDRMRAQSAQTNPLLEQIQRDLDEQLSRKIKSGTAMSRPRAVLTVPIVFHIIHNNGASNISNARILTAVQQLNDAFANRATYQTAGGVDMEIQFCLAQRDPSGNTTNGINRVVSPLTVMDMNSDDIAVKNLSRWTPTQYVNIWVVDEIVGGVAGYAYLPSAHGLNMDGIVLEDDWVGNSRANSAVLTHEMGHYFGIFHTFEGGCTNTDCTLNGDRVCDTPPDNTTSRPPCNAPANSCTSDVDDLSANNPFRPVANGGVGDQPDPISNYMDYSNFSCYDRFSAGQKVRALFFLNGTRQSLLNSLGCLPPCTSPISLSFSPSALTVTQGGTLSFNNTTSNATTYNWYANGVQFSTLTNPNFTFNTLGAVWIRLRANNADPNCYKEDSVQINVLCGAIAGFSASNLNPNIGTSVNFTFTGSGANAYEWYDNGTLFANTANTSRTFNAASSHAIKLVVQSATGCRDSITQIVRAVCPVVLGYNISNNYPRAGQTVTFTSSTTNATNLSWSVNGVPVSSATTYNYVAPATNFFRVCLTADNGVCTVTECQSVFVNTDTNNCNNTYLKTLGNNTAGWDIEPTTNGFLYIGGSVADSSLLVYVNGNGNALWQRKFKFTTGTDEKINKILLDSDGNLVCLSFSRTGTTQNTIFKYNPNTHSIIWSVRTNLDVYQQDIIEPTVGGNYLIIGQSQYAVNNGCDAISMQVDRNTGAILSANHNDLNNCEDLHKVVSHGGFLYATGRYTNGSGFANMRPAIIKMNAAGQSIWTKLYLYSQNVTARLYSYDMVLDRDSLVVSTFGDGAGTNMTNSTLFLFKTDTAGNPVWTRQYDLTNGTSDYAVRVLNLPDGYLILGYYDRAANGQEAFLLKTDKQGNQLWAKSYGTPQTDNFQDLVYTNQSVYAVGLTNGLGTAQNHILFARLDTAGNTQATCVNINTVASTQTNIAPYQITVRPTVTNQIPLYTNISVTPDSLELPATFQCATPCPENCTNGIDDDGDGLYDCADTTDCACNLCESGGGNNWFFGSRGAITFNTPSGEPTALPIAPIQTSEGSASISDVNGNLLFFTDGTTVWNRNYVAMPNGSGLFGDAISAQSGVIVPSPANDGKYYLYTVRNWTTGGNGIHYSVVDMNLQGGLGDVVSTQKNVFVNAAARESLSSTSHCNGRDAWVVFQEPTTNRYFAYLITSAGISPTPVISTVGSSFNGNNRYGYLRFSHDGRKLCMSLGGFGTSPTTVELYDFDNSTGQITNPQVLATTADLRDVYCSEFSPDDSRLYVTSFNGTHIFQYNLELNGTANIVASKTDIAGVGGFIKPSLQMAPNGKIYVSQNGQSILGVIENPNELGVNTNFNPNGVSIPGASCRLGLPNFNQSIFRITNLPNITGEDTLCQPYTNQTYRIKKRDACLTDTVIWRVLGTSTIVSRTDTSVIISPNGSGFDTLTVEIRERCATVFDTFIISKFNTPILNLPNDTTLCNNAPVPLNAGAGFVSYRWQNGATTNTYTADTEGWHRVTVTNVCNQSQMDSVFVNYDTLQIVAVPDTQLCFGDTFRIALNPAFNYQWTPNFAISCLTCSNPSFYPNVDTSYIGVITNPTNGCTAVDTFELTYRSCGLVDTVRIDTNICPYNTFAYRGRTVLPNTRDTLLVNANPRDTLYLVHATASPLPTLVDYQNGVSVVTPNCFGANTGRITFSWSQGAQPYTYLWSNGQFLPTATGLVDGVYSLTLRDAYGCTVSFSSTISSPAFLSSTLSSSVTSCNTATGASITSTYTGGNAPHTFLWSNGATTQNLTGIGTGGYRYTVTDANGCIAINYISVQIPSIPALNAFIGQLGTQDTSILFGDTVNINANANVSNLVYLWRELNQPSQAQIQNPNVSATSARPILSGNYVFVVSATVNGLPCASTDTVRLTVQPQTIFSLPTAFAPDGNGDNDRFRPIGLNSAYIKEFRIFNRWGQMLYDNATLSDGGWDGYYKGTLQNRDVYICVITYQRPQDAEPMTIRTEFTLLK